MAVIGIIATLDTKGKEAAFLREQIESLGHNALLIDSGMGFAPSVSPQVTREQLFLAAGIEDYKDLLAKNGKAAAQDGMRKGLGIVLRSMQAEDRIQGVLAVGGAQGTAMATAAMQTLPIGFPKVMVSTVACGSALFGDYVGNRDITMIPSIADICGLNSITIPVFSAGCGAVVGMAEAAELLKAKKAEKKPVIGLTMAGVTTPCVMRVKELLDSRGYETIVCHTNVVGSVVLNEMADRGELQAMLDITPHEWGGFLFDGLLKSDSERLSAVYNSAIPVISLPGCVDVMLKGPYDQLSPELQQRVHYAHTPFHTHLRTTYEEMYAVGKLIAEKHKLCRGGNAIIIPAKGYSMQNKEGAMFFDPYANSGFSDAVRDHAGENVKVIIGDYHINDPACADDIVSQLEIFMREGSGNSEYL